jgi:hypothetical protein
MNVLSQYGAGNGKGSGLFMQASFISGIPANLSDSDIHNVIQGAINRNHPLPRSSASAAL